MAERREREEAIEFLCKVADGEIPYDFEGLEEVHEENEAVPLACKLPPP